MMPAPKRVFRGCLARKRMVPALWNTLYPEYSTILGHFKLPDTTFIWDRHHKKKKKNH